MTEQCHVLAALEAPALGRALTGFGVNLLVRDVARAAAWQVQVLGCTEVRRDANFAVMAWKGQVWLLHSDASYHDNPLPSLMPESGPRGGGIELRLYACDPDAAAARVEAAGGMVLQPPSDKPHGLREAFLLDPDGYCWVPGRSLG